MLVVMHTGYAYNPMLPSSHLRPAAGMQSVSLPIPPRSTGRFTCCGWVLERQNKPWAKRSESPWRLESAGVKHVYYESPRTASSRVLTWHRDLDGFVLRLFRGQSK